MTVSPQIARILTVAFALPASVYVRYLAGFNMSNYYGGQPNNAYPGGGSAGAGAGAAAAQNLQFYPSSYSPAVSGAATPQQASYGGYGGGAHHGGGAGAGFSSAPGFGGAAGVTGRMGEQGGLRTGWLAAFSTEGYDGEPPLLEELGVNFGHIQMKTLAVLNPFKHIDQHLMDDSDLAGPILFFLLFGTFLLFSGKVHFGYIYGLALLGSTSLHMILSLMSPSDPHPGATQSFHPQYNDPSAQGHHDDPQHQPGGHFSATLTFPRSASVLGYCLLPLVATSLFGIVMPMDTPLGIVLTTAAIMWCTYSASGMFCAVGRMKGMRGLVAYPLALFYVGFGIMGIFSSRGSGSLAKVAATAKVNG
ncbi:golgi membrane protein [Purpureocillium lavendulum]|uniref:Protein YIP n=1 Tax=Purpureocillium lavendulum TaxID=1247861 RepID=A0AB34FLK2_9HYPO|nr:golgi membrane protein [Purpureocillium lavendulum]